MRAWVLLSIIIIGIVASFNATPSLGKNYLSIADIPLTLQLNGGEENYVSIAQELVGPFETYTFDEEQKVLETSIYALDFSQVSFEYSGYFQFNVPIENKLDHAQSSQSYQTMFVMDSQAPQIEKSSEKVLLLDPYQVIRLEEYLHIYDNANEFTIYALKALDFQSTKPQPLLFRVVDPTGNAVDDSIMIQWNRPISPAAAYQMNPWLEPTLDATIRDFSQEEHLQVYQSLITILSDYINNERYIHELDSFEGSNALYYAAMVRAQESHVRRSHTRPQGTSFQTALDEYGVPYEYGVEIIFSNNKIPHTVSKRLFQDLTVTKTLLNQYYTRMGIGYHQGTWVLILLN